MTTRFAEIMSALVNVPLLAHPRKAVIFYNALCGRFGTPAAELPETPDAVMIDALDRGPRASRFYGTYPESQDERGRAEPFKITRGGTGIITATGSLVNRGAWVGSNSGLTSYEGLKFQLDRARQDSRVKQVLLDMHTPGGEGVGAFEAGAAVRRLRETKPVIAMANGMAASAGYAMAAQATKIINSPTGLLGSIGVVLLHLDHSEELENKGIKPTLIFAGAHKVDGNPLEPLAESVKGELQSEVDRFYDLFVESVSDGRGRKASAKAIRDTEARTFMGRDAVDQRLADDVGTFEEVLADLDRKGTRSSRPASASTRSAKMLNVIKAGSISDDATEVVLAADAQAAIAAARTEGENAGKQAAAGEARTTVLTRFQSLLSNEKLKGKEAIALDLACRSPDMSADDVVAFMDRIAAPAAAAAVPSIAERAATTGAQGVTGMGGPDPRTTATEGENPVKAAVTQLADRQKQGRV